MLLNEATPVHSAKRSGGGYVASVGRASVRGAILRGFSG